MAVVEDLDDDRSSERWRTVGSVAEQVYPVLFVCACTCTACVCICCVSVNLLSDGSVL